MTQAKPSRISTKMRAPEIRARLFSRERDPPTKIENLLSRKQQSMLQSIGIVLEYQRSNTTIFSEGEDGHFVYSVITGAIRVSRFSENGRRQVMAFMLPGDLFGFPEAGRYLNSTETMCPTTLFRVPWQHLREMMLRDPEMQINFLTRIAFDLRLAQRRIMTLGQQNVPQRLVSFLLDLVQHPNFYDQNRRRLSVPFTRSDLGDYLGTAPETVIRAFAKLEKDGLIRRVSPHMIEIPDTGALSKIVGEHRRKRCP